MSIVWFGKENGSCTLLFHARPFISTAEITHFKYSAILLISMVVAYLISCKWTEWQQLLFVCCDIEGKSAEGKPVCSWLSPLLVRCVAVLYTWCCCLVSRAVSGVLVVCYWVSLSLCCPLFMVWDKAQLRSLCAICYTVLHKECNKWAIVHLLATDLEQCHLNNKIKPCKSVLLCKCVSTDAEPCWEPNSNNLVFQNGHSSVSLD